MHLKSQFMLAKQKKEKKTHQNKHKGLLLYCTWETIEATANIHSTTWGIYF